MVYVGHKFPVLGQHAMANISRASALKLIKSFSSVFNNLVVYTGSMYMFKILSF